MPALREERAFEEAKKQLRSSVEGLDEIIDGLVTGIAGNPGGGPARHVVLDNDSALYVWFHLEGDLICLDMLCKGPPPEETS